MFTRKNLVIAALLAMAAAALPLNRLRSTRPDAPWCAPAICWM